MQTSTLSTVTPYIQPSELIARHTVQEHLRFADAYFVGREDHQYLYQKPFYHPSDCAPSVSNLGLLFAGLRLASGMRVLEFAAGSCWLSRILVQLGCSVASCDASALALEIGKALFRKYPPIAPAYTEPEFCVFDGQRLAFDDASFDRIVVNDAFHHIPNMAAVLGEFFRVLKPDGLVAMSEPGRSHSQTEASQYEMQTFNVIENDFVLEDVWQMAQAAGFQDIRICPVLRETDLTLQEYLQCVQGEVPARVLNGVIQGTTNHSIFFLHKRAVRPEQKTSGKAPVVEQREDFDESFYLARYPDVATAVARGEFADAWQHYERHGRDEGRWGSPPWR